jgi:hypothetical protein
VNGNSFLAQKKRIVKLIFGQIRFFISEFEQAKLPSHRAALPGKVITFYIMPPDPAYKARLGGHLPVNIIYTHSLMPIIS